MKARKSQQTGTRALLYTRTSTDEQENGLDAQRERLIQEAGSRGWQYEVLAEHASGKTLARRPVLREALDRLDRDGGVLCVTKLDRLARSMLDFAAILERSRKRGWSLVALDLGMDTSTPNGEFAAHVLVAVAQLERRLIAQRTREALAVVKARGTQLGHPSVVTPETRSLILGFRNGGMSWRAIAERLQGDGVPGPRGPRWHPNAVRRIVARDAGSGSH